MGGAVETNPVTSNEKNPVVNMGADSDKEAKRLPVTLLSGFLGAGKTTLLKQILKTAPNGMKIALIVNDMGSINLDGLEIRKHKLVQEQAEMVELQNGCICCTLRGDLLKTVKELAEDKEANYDYLVIESTGISEPLPVAQTFTMDVGECDPENMPGAADANTGHDDHDHDHDGDKKNSGIKKIDEADFIPLSTYSRLDTLVTVVDAYNVLYAFTAVESLADREKFLGDDGVSKKKKDDASQDDEKADDEEEEKAICELLLDQIEFANVILVNKIDLLPAETRDAKVKQIVRLLKKLNPEAQVLLPGLPKFENFDVTKILNTNLFDMAKAQTSAGWLKELSKPAHTPETEEYGISSFVFRENTRPFHPARLDSVLEGFGRLNLGGDDDEHTDEKDDGNYSETFAGVVRSKGQLWLANADAFPIGVHTAGRQLEIIPEQMPYLAKVPKDEWDADAEAMCADLKKRGQWTEAFGDRSSELVCIGVDLDKKAIVAGLKSALLTDDEMATGPEAWKQLEDPFFNGNNLFDLPEMECELPEEEEEDEDMD